MTHLTDDIQIFLILGVGGSLTALAVCRVKYGAEWLEPWLTLTKSLSALALAVVGVGEHETLDVWWAAAPLLVSISLVSGFAWLVTGWILRRKFQDTVLDLESRGSATEATSCGTSSRWMFYWGVASAVLLLASFAVTIARVR